MGSGQWGELRLMSCLHEGERGPAPGQGLSDLGGRQSRGKEQHEEPGSTEGAPHRDSRPVSTALVPESAWALTAGILTGGEREHGALAGRRAGCETLQWLPGNMAGGDREQDPCGDRACEGLVAEAAVACLATRPLGRAVGCCAPGVGAAGLAEAPWGQRCLRLPARPCPLFPGTSTRGERRCAGPGGAQLPQAF